jgi:hypothetical protein
MKKTTLLLLVSFFCLETSSAQKLSFGIAGGLNMTSVQFDDNDEVDFGSTLKSSFNGGVFAQISLLKDKLILQPQIMYSAEGFVSKVQDTDSSNGTESETNLNFLNVPIILIFKPTKFFNIQFGPEFGRMLKAVAKGDVNKTTVTNIYNQNELGLNLGLGTTIAKVIDVNVRYNHGLTNLFDGNSSQLDGNEGTTGSGAEIPEGKVQISNRMFTVNLGLNISGLFRGKE